jgi:hypothetical protein
VKCCKSKKVCKYRQLFLASSYTFHNRLALDRILREGPFNYWWGEAPISRFFSELIGIARYFPRTFVIYLL